MKCPKCESKGIVKNGHIDNGKPKFNCKACGRQLVEKPEWRRVSDETKAQHSDELRRFVAQCRNKVWLLLHLSAYTEKFKVHPTFIQRSSHAHLLQ